MDRMETSIATGTLVGCGGGDLEDGILVFVGGVFGVFEGVFEVRSGRELCEGSECAIDGDVGFLFVREGEGLREGV